MFLMTRDFEIGRARAADRLRRADRARVVAEALAGARPRAAEANDRPGMVLAAAPRTAACAEACDQPAAVCEAA